MSNIGKIIRVNALPPKQERENNVIYQVAEPGSATYKDYAIDENGDIKTATVGIQQEDLKDSSINISEPELLATGIKTQKENNKDIREKLENKINKPSKDGNLQDFPKVLGLDQNGNTAKLPAGDLGKNVANSSLTTTTGAGLTLGDSWGISTYGLPYSIMGLADVSNDIPFNTLLAQNADGRIGKTNGKQSFLNLPASLNDTDKISWRKAMRLSNEIYSTGQPRIDSVILPFVDNALTFTQYITLIGLNLFVDNQTPNAKLVMKRVKDIHGNVLKTPEEYNIDNFNVLQNMPNVLNFGLKWNEYPQGYYQFFCTHNLLTNLSSPELLVKQGITFTTLNPAWQDLTGTAQVDSNNNIVLPGIGSARTNILIDKAQMTNGFVVKCSVATSVTNIGANFAGHTRFTMKGDDGLEYGVTLTANLDFYPDSSGGFSTKVDVLYISYYNGLLTLAVEVNGKTRVFSVTSIPSNPRYFYAVRTGGGGGAFTAKPTELLLL